MRATQAQEFQKVNAFHFLNSVSPTFAPEENTAAPFSSIDIIHPGLEAQRSTDFVFGGSERFSLHSFFSWLLLINLPLCNVVNVSEKFILNMFLPTSHKQLFLPTQTLTTYAHGNFQFTTHTSVEGKMCSGKYTRVYTYVHKCC